MEAREAVEAARRAGDARTLGRALTRLSNVTFREGGEDAPVEASARYAAEAVSLLRQTDDLAGLAAALRAAARPFVGVDVPALLDEALAVALASEDPVEVAWSLFARGNTFGGDLDLVRQAQAKFVDLGLVRGEALTLRTLASRDVDLSRSERARLMERAGDLLLEEDREEAYRSYFMAATFGSPEIGKDEVLRLLARATETTQNLKSRALMYRNMATVAEEAGDADLAASYRAQEDALDAAAYGSRANRLRSDLEALQEVLEVASRRERLALKAKMQVLHRELAALGEG